MTTIIYGRKLIMDSDGLTGIILILVLILYKAFCTVCETAVTEIDDRKIRNSSEKIKGKDMLLKLLEKPSRLVTAFAVNRVMTAIAISWLAMICFADEFAMLLYRLMGGNSVSEKVGAADPIFTVSAAIVILLASVLVITVFCEGIPKKIAVKGGDRLAYFCGSFVKYLVIILTPMTALSSLLIKVFSPIFGVGGIAERDVVTEEEILLMVDAGNETGVIEESQREMINNVFEFDDLILSDVMTHRTDVVAVEDTAGVSEVVNASIGSGFSRIPVYEDTVDHITGIICVKDLLCLVGSEAAESADIKSFVRDIIYLPESVPCGEAFKRLTAEKMQMAVVIDEYGGTAGLVTMEDIVETIVGNIQDEYDDEAEEIIQISEDTYTIDGTADPEEIMGKLGAELPEENKFDTMSGFIVELLGRIPEEDENPSVGYGNVMFTVLLTEDKCITKIKAQIIDLDDGNNENSKKESLKNEEEN
ncbi:MAG: HlyC/CorC family transporter [Oscillospiraceae bacterium]|nr:HlyC/CorC family transporter [Oscillospiraceae bacterium]